MKSILSDRKEINIIIPLGGLGERFSREGYHAPKPLVRVLGEPMILHVVRNLKPSNRDLLLIVYHGSLRRFHFEETVLRAFPDVNIRFVALDHETQGAAETVLHGVADFSAEELKRPTMLADGDSLFVDDVIEPFREQGGNLIFYFQDPGDKPIYSYLKTTQTGQVTDIAEKVQISRNACIGAYGFSSAQTLVTYCEKSIQRGVRIRNEFYISTVYSVMLEERIPVYARAVKEWECLGTPVQLQRWAEKNRETCPKKRICFDLDNTIVSYPIDPGNYETCTPITRNINFLTALKKEGHYIIIYTARRMRTHDGDIQKATEDIGKLTKKQLNEFGVVYDELIFGKPYADLYVDDLSISPFANIEKDSGFYMSSQIPPRSWHQTRWIPDAIEKTADPEEICAEVNWYERLPEELNYLVPKLRRSTETTIELERINGVPLSFMLVQNTLDVSILKKVLYALESIHLHPVECDSNIYANYVRKCQQRYQQMDRSIREDAKVYKNKLLAWLKQYEERDMGIPGFIHGDPVFTNILFTADQDIKFIDPRGRIDGRISPAGDIFYDFSKVYQSLCNYDAILLGRQPSHNAKLIKVFENFVGQRHGQSRIDYIRIITASLFFSLIPLHDRSLHRQFLGMATALIDMVEKSTLGLQS